MLKIEVRCLHCNSKEVIKFGTQANGAPRCRCKVCKKTFQTEYVSEGASPKTKKLIIAMSVNGSGIRDISRVLRVSRNTITAGLKNRKTPCQRKSQVSKSTPTCQNTSANGRNVGASLLQTNPLLAMARNQSRKR